MACAQALSRHFERVTIVQGTCSPTDPSIGAGTTGQAGACAADLRSGPAQKTLFIARYLRDRGLQREINEGLNIIEAWNRANTVIIFGKGGDIATNRRDEQRNANRNSSVSQQGPERGSSVRRWLSA